MIQRKDHRCNVTVMQNSGSSPLRLSLWTSLHFPAWHHKTHSQVCSTKVSDVLRTFDIVEQQISFAFSSPSSVDTCRRSAKSVLQWTDLSNGRKQWVRSASQPRRNESTRKKMSWLVKTKAIVTGRLIALSAEVAKENLLTGRQASFQFQHRKRWQGQSCCRQEWWRRRYPFHFSHPAGKGLSHSSPSHEIFFNGRLVEELLITPFIITTKREGKIGKDRKSTQNQRRIRKRRIRN